MCQNSKGFIFNKDIFTLSHKYIYKYLLYIECMKPSVSECFVVHSQIYQHSSNPYEDNSEFNENDLFIKIGKTQIFWKQFLDVSYCLDV